MHTTAIVAALAGIWLGALVAIDLIETPAKFTIPGLERKTAVALGRVVFRRLGWLELALGAALIEAAWRTGGLPLAFSLALWLIALALCLVVRPALEQRIDDDGQANPDPSQSAERLAAQWLHRVYVAADGAKMLLLIALLAIAVRS